MQLEKFTCDVAIIGGGFGAVAAAIALTDRGFSVVMTDEFAWIGGQVTSQSLCVLDEFYDPIGETVMNRRYAEFRQAIRTHYATRYRLSELGLSQQYLAPGNAACSSVTAEPHVAYQVILAMLKPAVDKGLLHILPHHVPTKAKVNHDRVEWIQCEDIESSHVTTVHARFFLDGTETGDTYPLLGLKYRLGSESRDEFHEPHAPEHADRQAIQSFTYCCTVEFVPGGNFVIPKPEGYEKIRDKQRFRLCCLGGTEAVPGNFFTMSFTADGGRVVPFWYYRSLVDKRNFNDPQMPYDRAVINVGCNDYHDEAFVENPRKADVLEQARRLTRAYVYWLQTEAPRDDGGFGYPEIRPMPEAAGTPDGLAQAPYVREGRRLAACQTIVEQDLSVASQHESRAHSFRNSVGVGAYMIDIHKCSGRQTGMAQMTRPYQIPLGALVTPQLTNFAVAGKGIGVTQITNGAYRLHPTEWNIGEAAGELAAYCLEHPVAHPNIQGQDLFNLQRRLLAVGIPLYWFEDIATDHPAFQAVQILGITGLWPGDPAHLRFDPQQSICRHLPTYLRVMSRIRELGTDLTDLRNMHIIAHDVRKSAVARQIVHYLDVKGWPQNIINGETPTFAPSDFTPRDPAKLW